MLPATNKSLMQMFARFPRADKPFRRVDLWFRRHPMVYNMGPPDNEVSLLRVCIYSEGYKARGSLSRGFGFWLGAGMVGRFFFWWHLFPSAYASASADREPT